MVKLCWAHGLYDAIFYVYNRGMRDYTTPLEVLIETNLVYRQIAYKLKATLKLWFPKGKNGVEDVRYTYM